MINVNVFRFGWDPLLLIKPLLVRASLHTLNTIDRLLRIFGVRPRVFSSERLLEEAQIRTNLTDFGPDDFREGLCVLIESVERDTTLSRSGRHLMETLYGRLLVNRLLIEVTFKRYPEIAQTPLYRPLIVVGLYRSGTTLLHHMLSQDPRARTPLMWELSAPAPPPAVSNRTTDPRIQAVERAVRKYNIRIPELKNIHTLSASNPEECSLLLQNTFKSAFFFLNINVPSYLEWLLKHDMVETYSYYRKQLQILQWECIGDHLVLKAPEHLLFLDALLTMFPDACIVHVHRDPCKTVASTCSLIMALRSLWIDRVDRVKIGQQTVGLLTAMVNRAMRVRAVAEPHRFYDVHYNRLIGEPIRTVQEIYEYFGYDYSGEFANALDQFIEANQRNRQSTHRYSLQQFGLTQDALAERFADYCRHFAVAAE